MELLSVNSQEELSLAIHRPSANPCLGECETCRALLKARKAAHMLALNKGVTLRVTQLDNPICNEYYQAWCEECSDGLNENAWEAAVWVTNHAHKKHSTV